MDGTWRIRSVRPNNHVRAFEVCTAEGAYSFPYSRCAPVPSGDDPIEGIVIDAECAYEVFVYRLRSGAEGEVHIEQVLDYNSDPAYFRDLLLFDLSMDAQQRVRDCGLSKREIARRLGTSAAQLYRLLDQTNYRKTVDRMLELLHVLDCDVEFVVRPRSA